jgi:hypothetical protein
LAVLTHKRTLSVGVKVEGILRQSADVEEVKRRVRDYEKGHFLLLEILFFLSGITMFGVWQCLVKLINELSFSLCFHKIIYECCDNVHKLHFCLL